MGFSSSSVFSSKQKRLKLNQRSWGFFFHSREELKTRKYLKAFILRARVLKLYRQSLRIAQRAPGDSKDELRNAIRQEIEKNRDCNDKQRIRFLISEGLERLKSLDEMLDMQGH